MKHTTQASSQPQHQEIQMLAYHLWEQAGHPAGKSLDLWLEAEEQEMQKFQALWSLPAGEVRKAIQAGAVAQSQPKAASPAGQPAKGTVKAADNGAEKPRPAAAPKKSTKVR